MWSCTSKNFPGLFSSRGSEKMALENSSSIHEEVERLDIKKPLEMLFSRGYRFSFYWPRRFASELVSNSKP